ncbi:hypothetical protein VHEMI05623 [[Torrubiella] hemipterigena]|uniref:Alpha/beta hydrolase fold-3 domain-containing protein n=1 Tax=[Torrubiella] hemipterigena TaxID=1531966 RepID=A0A0A1T4R3_9HYPO|nr:hypothetical protein VHEMI05623 [[Torrubiella] hemipterigena]
MGLTLDPDYAAASAEQTAMALAGPRPADHDVALRRQLFSILEAAPTPESIPPNVAYEILHTETPDGYKLPIYHVWNKTAKHDAANPSPAVLHAHAGGMILLTPVIALPLLFQYVAATGIPIFSVDYRLAPEHPYPTPPEDCWTGLTWLIANAAKYTIDTARIAVMGESAGAGLAAALTLMARDRGLSPPIARQILAFPMLDDRNKEKLPESVKFTLWSESDNLTGWTAYLGDKLGTNNVPIYAAPARVTDVTGLPPLYVDIGQIDLFVKETSRYVNKFIEADIEVEFHVYPGLPHGWGAALTYTGPATKAYVENRIAQLKKL